MNIFMHIRGTIENSIEALSASGTVPADLDLSKIGVEPPRDPDHGDISTNAAMVIAKGAGMKPRDLGLLLAEGLVALGVRPLWISAVTREGLDELVNLLGEAVKE